VLLALITGWGPGAGGAAADDLLEIHEVAPEDRVCFALYTVHDGVLKLTAQLYPLASNESIDVRLEVERDGGWEQIAETEVLYPGWTAPFRIEGWDASKDVRYRVRHGQDASFEGVIKKDPVDEDEIVVAAFTGNSPYGVHGGTIPKDDIIANLKAIEPDLLFFSGDQVYDHSRHLSHWLRFGREFGEVIGSIPTVTIPDDHDVGQANLWGEEGKKSASRAGPDGGYYMPVEYVREVQRAQTSHLPDAYDPTPVERGIGVYYTELNVGGVSFAIIEDRKFKTGPEGRVPRRGPRPDHINEPFDPKSVDLPDLQLLGERQLAFLRDWASDWIGADMKAVLSQTIFAGGAHVHGRVGGRLLADLDSNGWPPSGRARALGEMRKAFAFHLAGDQHLGTVFHHGIDDWNDAGYSFCVPSIANLYLRWWDPLEPGGNRQPGMPEHLGEHRDGFGNKLTAWAVANPSKEPNGGEVLTTRAAGFGVVRFDKKTRRITMECWPRNVDVTRPEARQYEGWPLTIHQEDNYGRKAVAYLPELKVTGAENPILQVIAEPSGEIVYTLRLNGDTHRPKVFAEGTYTIRLCDETYDKSLPGILALPPSEKKTLEIEVTQ
jgi:hypothetical protein